MPGIHIAMLILDQPDIHPIKWSMVFTRKENNINVKKKVYMSMKKIMDSFYRFMYATVGSLQG